MSQVTTFINAFLIDGLSKEPKPDTKVVVEDSHIKEVSIGDNKTASLQGRVIDLKGKTLMPGLIDMHVHPGSLEPSLAETAALPPAVYVHRVTKILENDLNLGFTTLRCAGGLDIGFKAATDQGFINGPRLLLSVSPLACSIGYPEGIVPPRNSLGIRPEVCDGPSRVLAAARRTLGRGADQIKVFADGEVLSMSPYDHSKPGNVKFSVEELSMAVKAAESMDTYVMAHTYCPEAITNCVKAGVRSIEHGNLMDRKTAALMAEHKTCYVPTLAVYDLALNSSVVKWDDKARAKLVKVADKGYEALEMAFQEGVTIGSGSDIVGPGQEFKGNELFLQAEIMGPMEAIWAATKNNAQIAGLSDELGTIEPGKIADMIVLDQDPLKNMKIFSNKPEHVLMVMKQGTIAKNILQGQ